MAIRPETLACRGMDRIRKTGQKSTSKPAVKAGGGWRRFVRKISDRRREWRGPPWRSRCTTRRAA
eukprot:882410-Heterocapsa_arctica.AAC.1